MTKAKDLQFAKTLAKYKGTWVALKDSRIIASGEDVEKVQKSAEKKKVRGYMLHFVPLHRLAMPERAQVPDHSGTEAVMYKVLPQYSYYAPTIQ
jgi:Family of unknown function (DUF5678)